ncbi:MAG: hypothetical protein DWQ02_11695 [Bacteroidetes bacterium]|nr:MAG: hypothetical protein DWQ02_11695 [Bacteroidota bacterium]
MKNQTLLSLVFLLVATQFAVAQSKSKAFKPMKYPYFEASASIGMLPTFVKDISRSEVPPVAVNVSYRINERFSAGLFGGYTQAMSNPDMFRDGQPMTFNTKFSMLGARFAVHSTKYKRWDVYGGFGLNYTHTDIEVLHGDVEKLKKHKRFEPCKGRIMMSAFVGSKYAINPSFSVFGEVGYGISLLNLGVSKRF